VVLTGNGSFPALEGELGARTKRVGDFGYNDETDLVFDIWYCSYVRERASSKLDVHLLGLNYA
jgi:hypothetical protein